MLQSYNALFQFMEVLGEKWIVPLLIFILFYEKTTKTTFTTIKKQLKITSRALSKKLKLLEALGLVERLSFRQYVTGEKTNLEKMRGNEHFDKIVVDNPKKMIYTLSEKGKEISEMILGFAANIK